MTDTVHHTLDPMSGLLLCVLHHQGEASVHKSLLLDFQVRGNSGFVVSGAGAAGFEVIVEFVITIGWVKGTRASFGCWSDMSVSTTFAMQIISTMSSSDIATNLQNFWDCCCMWSSRHWDCWRKVLGSMVIWPIGASSCVNMFWGEEVSGRGVQSEYCALSWTTQF